MLLLNVQDSWDTVHCNKIKITECFLIMQTDIDTLNFVHSELEYSQLTSDKQHKIHIHCTCRHDCHQH